MSDLQALLLERFADEGPDGRIVVRQEALATRLPECVPPGMEWDDEHGWFMESKSRPRPGHSGTQSFCLELTDEIAKRQYIGHNVEQYDRVSITKRSDSCTVMVSYGGRDYLGRGNSKSAALAAALHRLADEKETKDANTPPGNA